MLFMWILGCTSPEVVEKQGNTTGVSSAAVELVQPEDGASYHNPLRVQAKASAEVVVVGLLDEGGSVGERWAPDTAQRFWLPEGSQRLELVGYNGDGEPVASDRAEVRVLPPELAFLAPEDEEWVRNPVSFVLATAGVDQLRLSADGWLLCEGPAEAEFSCDYTFSDTWRSRSILAEGLDPDGNVVVSAERSITPVTEGVELRSPTENTVENPVLFSFSSYGMALTRLYADQYLLTEVSGDGLFEYSHTFSGTGYAREIRLEGYNTGGELLAQDSMVLTVQSPGEISLAVPYYYQYNNSNEPGATCGLTSASMVVGYWTQQTVDPDDLYRSYGKGQAQSPEGLAQLYGWEGLYSTSGRDATRAELRQHLDAGRPVVVHGDWTGSGHIVVLVGYTDTDWIVNDPAGDWYSCYGCGEADHIHYPLGGAWDDAMSWDGDIWYSVASTSPL
jgi:hypothetical protein